MHAMPRDYIQKGLFHHDVPDTVVANIHLSLLRFNRAILLPSASSAGLAASRSMSIENLT